MFDDKQAEKAPAPAPSRLAPEPALSAADEAELLVAVQAEVQAELAGRPRPKRHPRHIRHARLWDVLKRAVQENLLGQHVRGGPRAPGNNGKYTNEEHRPLGHLPPVPAHPPGPAPAKTPAPAKDPVPVPAPPKEKVPVPTVPPPVPDTEKKEEQKEEKPRTRSVKADFYENMALLINEGGTRIDLDPVVAELRRSPALTITIVTNVAVGPKDSHSLNSTINFTDKADRSVYHLISARELMLKRGEAIRKLLIEEGVDPARVRVAPGRVVSGEKGLRSTIIFKP